MQEEMTVIELIRYLLIMGDIFIVRRKDCVSGATSFEVQTERNEVLFEVTEKWFNMIHATHRRAWEHLTPCGCVCYVIIPNGVDFDEAFIKAHLN